MDKFKLSPEASIKWISCPLSAKLESQINCKEEKELNPIEELAKEIVKIKLNHYLERSNTEDVGNSSRNILDNRNYSKELEEALDNLVNMAINIIEFDKLKDNTPIILINEDVDCSLCIEESRTIVPIAIFTKNSLEIISYNVNVESNEIPSKLQAIEIQALGVINDYISLYAVDNVNITYVEVNTGSIYKEHVKVAELLDKAYKIIRPAAQQASIGNGEVKVGEYCNLCKAQTLCKEKNEELINLMTYDTREPLLLTEEQIITILQYGDKFKKWIDDVNKYALEQSLSFNKSWENFKLVEGRSSRKYKDELAVKEALLEAGYEERQLINNSLLSLSSMEKVVGKTRLVEILGDLIIRPKGKYQLAPVTDKRPEKRIPG